MAKGADGVWGVVAQYPVLLPYIRTYGWRSWPSVRLGRAR